MIAKSASFSGNIAGSSKELLLKKSFSFNELEMPSGIISNYLAFVHGKTIRTIDGTSDKNVYKFYYHPVSFEGNEAWNFIDKH